MGAITETTCPDCAADVGQRHDMGCDIARCPECGEQRIQCHEPVHAVSDHLAVWAGEFPGKADCRQLGWYAIFKPGAGWMRAAADDLEAREDLNRLVLAARTGELVWDRDVQRFVTPAEVAL